MSHLFHFSEDGTIPRFEPRAPLAHPDTPPYVWAIDEWHSPIYFFPRDCPRACFWPLSITTQEDQETIWATASGRLVIAIEAGWFDRVRSARIYRYTFNGASFESVEDHGVHVSAKPVEPISVEAMDDLVQHIVDAGVELRICPSIVPLSKALMRSSLHFSLIRMRNADGWDLPPGGPSLPRRRLT